MMAGYAWKLCDVMVPFGLFAVEGGRVRHDAIVPRINSVVQEK